MDVRTQLFSAEKLTKIVAGSQKVTSCVDVRLCGDFGLFGKCNHFFKLHAMFLKKFITTNCQSLTRKVFTTPRAYGKPNVGIRATTNRRPLLPSCFELMSSSLPNNKANQPSHCTLTQSGHKPNQPRHCALTHGGHKYKPNEPSHCTQWPLRQITCCGHKPNELSHCTQWPLRQRTCCGHKPNEPSDCARWPLSQMKSQMDTELISADCSSQDHDEALTSCYSCERIENQINDYSVTISEKVEAHEKRVNCQRKRDREPSRIPVKRILKALKKRKSRKRIQSFVRQHLPDSSFISDLCKNYKTWNLWYTTDHFYSKFVFYVKIQKRKCKRREKYSTHSCRQTYPCARFN